VFGFGWMELLLVLVIVLIIFGAGKLPQLGEGVGKAIKGFKKSVYEPEPQLEAQAIAAAPAVGGAPANTSVQQEAGKAQIPAL
jgi:sec-independent protein translocase protein TatA